MRLICLHNASTDPVSHGHSDEEILHVTVKFLNFWTPENVGVIYLKFKQKRQT